MADQSPPPDASAPAAAPDPAAPPVDQGGVFEYVGTTARTYLFAGAPPQTAASGDVCLLPVTPLDGFWVPSRKKVTRLPDNHPDQAALTAAAQTAERERVLAEAAKRDAEVAASRAAAARAQILKGA